MKREGASCPIALGNGLGRRFRFCPLTPARGVLQPGRRRGGPAPGRGTGPARPRSAPAALPSRLPWQRYLNGRQSEQEEPFEAGRDARADAALGADAAVLTPHRPRSRCPGTARRVYCISPHQKSDFALELPWIWVRKREQRRGSPRR